MAITKGLLAVTTLGLIAAYADSSTPCSRTDGMSCSDGQDVNSLLQSRVTASLQRDITRKESKATLEACVDIVPPGQSKWHDEDGADYDCAWYAVANRCAVSGAATASFGYTANMACCACGGGYKVGRCYVKIQGDTTGSCGSVPKNEWFDDDSYGGALGDSATYTQCSSRGWAAFCGTTVNYKIVAAPQAGPAPTPPVPTTPAPSKACVDIVPSGQSKWHDADGADYDCAWYAVANRCAVFGAATASFGHTANMACCACGGGYKVGRCYVKIQGDTTGSCGSVPKNEWFDDDSYGGALGDSATYTQCSSRGWAAFCGTTAQYKIEA